MPFHFAMESRVEERKRGRGIVKNSIVRLSPQVPFTQIDVSSPEDENYCTMAIVQAFLFSGLGMTNSTEPIA